MKNTNRIRRDHQSRRADDPSDEEIASMLNFFGACKYAVNAFETLPMINVKTDSTGAHFIVTAPNSNGKKDALLMTITRAPGGFAPNMATSFAPQTVARRAPSDDEAEFYGIDDIF